VGRSRAWGMSRARVATLPSAPAGGKGAAASDAGLMELPAWRESIVAPPF